MIEYQEDLEEFVDELDELGLEIEHAKSIWEVSIFGALAILNRKINAMAAKNCSGCTCGDNSGGN